MDGNVFWPMRPSSSSATRRRSDETLSAFSPMPPPYALSDVFRRPIAFEEARYGYRIDTLGVRVMYRWDTKFEDFQVAEAVYTHQDLPESTRAIVENLKMAIKIGHSLLQKLWKFKSVLSEADGHAHYSILAVWYLCVSVGASMCESTIHTSPGSTKDASDNASAALRSMTTLYDLAQEYGLMDDSFESSYASAERQRAAYDFTVVVQERHGSDLSRQITNLTFWSFEMSIRRL